MPIPRLSPHRIPPFNGTQRANKPRGNSLETRLKGDDARFSPEQPADARVGCVEKAVGPWVHCVAATAIMRRFTPTIHSLHFVPAKLNCLPRLSSDPPSLHCFERKRDYLRRGYLRGWQVDRRWGWVRWIWGPFIVALNGITFRIGGEIELQADERIFSPREWNNPSNS